MTVKHMGLLTLEEAIAQPPLETPAATRPVIQKQVNRSPLAPSSERLPYQTREIVLPPQLLPGPFSILLR